jgi:isopenicillin N synthase-like dioxygenase
MLKLWTSNLYQSTPHKVVHANNDNYRTSIPFFFEPNFDAIIETLPLPAHLFENKKKPEPFAPIKYGDHITKKVLGNFTFGDAPMKQDRYS